MENQKVKVQFTLRKFIYNFGVKNGSMFYKITFQTFWKIFDKVKQDETRSNPLFE